MRPAYDSHDACKLALARAMACESIDELFTASATRWQMLIDSIGYRPAKEVRVRWAEEDKTDFQKVLKKV